MIETSCHCGAVRIQAPDPEQLTSCNCSLCRRINGLWAYYPPAEVTVIAEEGATVAYVQGDRTLANHHCAACGCATHWSPLDPASNRMAVNMRLAPPEAIEGVRVRHFDGADTWTYLD